jgi:hypothetical protein
MRCEGSLGVRSGFMLLFLSPGLLGDLSGGTPLPPSLGGYFGDKILVFNGLQGVGVCKILITNGLAAKYSLSMS